MPVQTIQPSFAAGEISPMLYSRVDLAKYHIGVRTMLNWYTHAQGGASNRPGTGWVGPTIDSTKLGRLLPFQYSTVQTYVLEFGDFKMRVIKDGGYVTETPKNIAGVTKASPGNVNIVAHGFATGDVVYAAGAAGMTQLNNRFFTIIVTGADHFTIGVDTTGYGTWTSGGTFARVYTTTTPYAYADLPLLKYEQSADTMTLTHKSYAPYKLTRSAHTNWTFTPITFAPTQQPPASVVSGAAGSAAFYAVTAINDTTGEESLQSADCGSSTTTSTLTWTAISGASTYSVYRKTNGVYGFIGTAQAPGGGGSTTFTDTSIVPDTSVTPPQQRNPFGAGTVTAVIVVHGGSGYSSSVAVSAVDTTGSGATFTVTRSGGAIASVAVNTPGLNYSQNTTLMIRDGTGTGATIQLNFIGDGSGVNYQIDSATVTAGGSGYAAGAYCTVIQPNGSNNGAAISLTVAGGAITAAAVTNAGFGFNPAFPFPYATVTDAAGTGGVLTATITPDGTTFPGVNTYHDGRQWFMSTMGQPQTLWGSVSGAFNNMSVSVPTRDSDAITRTLASRQVNDIKHAVSLTQMILLTGNAEWKVSAGSADVITPAQFVARPQSYNGSSDIRPIVVNDTLLYVPGSKRKVRSLQYQWAADVWTGVDMSLLASHLFELSGNNTNQMVNWQFARDPESIIWAVRDDGTLLGFTFNAEQQVYAWHRHTTTNGDFEDVCCIQEGDETAVYFIVERTINGSTVRYVERLQSRAFADITEAWFLDCAIQTTGRNSDVTKTAKISGATYNAGDSVTLSFTNIAPLASSYVGKMVVLQSGGDVVGLTVTAISNPASATATLTQAAPVSLQNVATSSYFLPISGLWHLIGETVYMLADGVPFGPLTVDTDGEINAAVAATTVIVGKIIPDADLELLDLEQPDQAGTLQGRKKKINHLTVALKNSANQGLKGGPSGGQGTPQLYAFKPKDLVNPLATAPSTAPALITDFMHEVNAPQWDWHGRTLLRISASPLPYTVTGIMVDVTAG